MSATVTESGFLRDWPRYRIVFWLLVLAIATLGLFVANDGWGERLAALLLFGLFGMLFAALGYPFFWLLCRLADWLDRVVPTVEPPRWPIRPAGPAPMLRKPQQESEFGAGVAIVRPASRPKPEKEAKIFVRPGVRWLAGKMAVWREQIGRRAALPRLAPWQSADEAAGALDAAVRPAIQRLARELQALAEICMMHETPGEDCERAALRFEAALEYWLELGKELRRRSFPHHAWMGERKFHAILDCLDARLRRCFDAYIRFAEHPFDAIRHADASGTVELKVDFDCASEVEEFARWAEHAWRPRQGADFWWLVSAFALGYWIGDDG